VVTGGLGVGLLSIKALVLQSIRPWSLGFPLLFLGLSLEDTNWGDS